MENGIESIVKHLSKNDDEVYAKVCEVLEVNATDKTIDVKPIDGTAEIFNVRLLAESETGGLVLIPKVGSLVLVVFLNKNNAAVVNTSEIKNYELKIENCELSIDGAEFLFKKTTKFRKKGKTKQKNLKNMNLDSCTLMLLICLNLMVNLIIFLWPSTGVLEQCRTGFTRTRQPKTPRTLWINV